jgi:hypothetical protein
VKSVHILSTLALAAAMAACGPRPAHPQQVQARAASTATTTVTDGGSVVTDLGMSIRVNDGSTMRRSFADINDSEAPLQITDVGVASNYTGSGYDFSSTGVVRAKPAIAAFELRFVLFDMFGNRIKTLSGTHIVDVAADAFVALATAVRGRRVFSWYASENDVSELFTVVAFVANVRTADGKIWRYNERTITDELARLNLKIAAGGLTPTETKP